MVSDLVIDLHMHTRKGAYDSSLHPERLAEEARRVGLTGVAITEHNRLWDRHALGNFRDEQSPLVVHNGMEVSTELGHILAFGLPGYPARMDRIAELRRYASDVGGFLAVAHPFRYWFEPVHFTRRGLPPVEMVPDVLAKQPVFEYVDAVEVLNGACSERENLMALAVANLLGKPGIGGSDCHSEHGIGIACTVFERAPETEESFLEELRAGRFFAAYDLPRGELRRFSLNGKSAVSD
jgi:predicted metal-dependent phosphoesterase TrpH